MESIMDSSSVEQQRESEFNQLFSEWIDFIEKKNWDYYTQTVYFEEFLKSKNLFSEFLEFARQKSEIGL